MASWPGENSQQSAVQLQLFSLGVLWVAKDPKLLHVDRED